MVFIVIVDVFWVMFVFSAPSKIRPFRDDFSVVFWLTSGRQIKSKIKV